MPRNEEACPFSAETRAERCQSCWETTAGLTPCVAAFLQSPVGIVDRLEILPPTVRRMDRVARRAA